MEVDQASEQQRAALRKLGEDLRTLAADAEQLLLATADALGGEDQRRARTRGRVAARAA